MIRRSSVKKLPRTFFVIAVMSLVIIIMLKITMRNIPKSPQEERTVSGNLKILARATTRYVIERDGMAPRKLSDLYPGYCDDLSAFTSPNAEKISSAEEIDYRSSFEINEEVPPSLENVHRKRSLLFVVDTAPLGRGETRYAINANLEVIAVTELSKKTLGLTTSPAGLDEEKVDLDGDGKVDERRFLSGNELVYSISILRDSKGLVLREAWYDGGGRLTSDYGPSFRKYNYDKKDRPIRISNHFSNRDLAEVLGVARILFEYSSGKVIKKYYRANGSLIYEDCKLEGRL